MFANISFLVAEKVATILFVTADTETGQTYEVARVAVAKARSFGDIQLMSKQI